MLLLLLHFFSLFPFAATAASHRTAATFGSFHGFDDSRIQTLHGTMGLQDSMDRAATLHDEMISQRTANQLSSALGMPTRPPHPSFFADPLYYPLPYDLERRNWTAERETLETFFVNLGGPGGGWSMEANGSPLPNGTGRAPWAGEGASPCHCDWFGVLCSPVGCESGPTTNNATPGTAGAAGTVVGLFLGGGRNLTGTLPRDLTALSNLGALDLSSSTNIIGSLPPSLAKLPGLRLLNLANLGLQDTAVPPDVQEMCAQTYQSPDGTSGCYGIPPDIQRGKACLVPSA